MDEFRPWKYPWYAVTGAGLAIAALGFAVGSLTGKSPIEDDPRSKAP